MTKDYDDTTPINEPALYLGDTRLVRLPELTAWLGVNKSSIQNWVRFGHMPRPVKLGPRAVAWKYSDIKTWLDSQGEGGGQDFTARTRKPAADAAPVSARPANG
ncbi:helix-turn-helix transcriptional regulator [Reyranella sp.]|uniref:helix-turn-helix transcriptional regulator n=1 Tax=Reyranella sp. TaxID=1929291 RepID=UPI003784D29B